MFSKNNVIITQVSELLWGADYRFIKIFFYEMLIHEYMTLSVTISKLDS